MWSFLKYRQNIASSLKRRRKRPSKADPYFREPFAMPELDTFSVSIPQGSLE